jgi:mono/diheme cytochrome c family protein
MNARDTVVVAATGRSLLAARAAASRDAILLSISNITKRSDGARAFARRPTLRLALALALLASLATAQVALSAEPAGAASGGAQNVGQLTYEKWCAPCHAPGPQHPGTQALDALYKGSKPGALIQRTDLTPPIVKQFVRMGVSVMPFFRKTEISDAELDALAVFLSKQK